MASKSFDSASSSGSSSSNGNMNQSNMSNGLNGVNTLPGGANGQDASVYDKLRLLNGGQPWAAHGSAWYVPSPVSATAAAAAAAAVGVAYSQLNGPVSPSQLNNNTNFSFDPLNENHPNIHGHHAMTTHHHQHHHSNSNEMKLDLNGNDFKKGNLIII